ncbi:MAG: porin [Hyphomicrobiaceae bacterium]
MKKLSLIALSAVLAGGITTANAADLGGNCCADLEERIAELEATTVRKGNRKVSLTISGWVAQQVTYWDDGIESNLYVSDIGTTLASHVKFTGSAQISSDVSAGYVLHIEAISNEPLAVNQAADNAGRAVGVLQSFWYLKSNTLGKLSVGQQSSAADNVGILPDGSGSLVAANYVMFDNNNFGIRLAKVNGVSIPGSPNLNTLLNGAGPLNNKSGAGTWGSLATCGALQIGVSADCDGVPNNNIRYDTPTFAGFSASASWGEDDVWALAGRYAGEHSGFKLAGAIAYTESTDNGVGVNGLGLLPATNQPDGNPSFRRSAGALQMGAYIQHVQSGLFLYGAYGKDYNSDLLTPAEVAAAGRKKADGDNFYLKPGVRTKMNSLGHSVFFGEYGENNDKQSVQLFNAGVTSSNITQWGLGYVQEIDAAAMSLWVVYRNYSAEATIPGFKLEGEDLNIVKVGGMINF